MKKTLLAISLMLSLINFVSAKGSYSNFSPREFIGEVHSLIYLGITFLILFFVWNWAINRGVLKGKWEAPLILTLFSTHGLTKIELSPEKIFDNLGFPLELVYDIMPWILLLLTIIFLWKFGFGILFITYGVIFIELGIGDFVLAKGFVMLSAGILILIGLWMLRKKKPKGSKELLKDEKKSEKIQRETRKKYLFYSRKIQQLFNKYKKIPSRKSINRLEARDGRRYHRLIRAMKDVEDLAKKKRIIVR